MPPPTHTTRPGFSPCSPLMSVGRPRGPRIAGMESPSPMAQSFMVEAPTAWQIRVMVPLAESASAIVNGILSPNSVSTIRMTNCPAFRSRAIRGASTSSRKTLSERARFFSILCMVR